MWYFAQPFRGTGALVLMIGNIIQDCILFLGLAFIVLFGFGLAMYILFRHEAHGDEGNEEASDTYGSLQASLLTLFYALVGGFEPEVEVLEKHGFLMLFHSAGLSICSIFVMVDNWSVLCVHDCRSNRPLQFADCHHGGYV
mgnify:CR=1 FL=1